MTTPNGYNNPAYCHQYDSSLYDYQYVAEIDPSSPNLSEESNRRQIKLIPPNYETGFLTGSDGFGESDESNGSIIIEECNNRRVTLICEKRNQTEVKRRECNEEQNRRADYYQDVSLESENGYDDEGNEAYLEGRSEDRNRCRRRSSESQTEQKNSSDQGRNYFRVNNNEKNSR